MAYDFELRTCMSSVYAHRATRQTCQWELASLNARKGPANLEFLVGKGLNYSTGTVSTIREFTDRVKALTRVHKDAPELCVVSSVNDLYRHRPYPRGNDYAGSDLHVVVDEIKINGSASPPSNQCVIMTATSLRSLPLTSSSLWDIVIWLSIVLTMRDTTSLWPSKCIHLSYAWWVSPTGIMCIEAISFTLSSRTCLHSE